MTTVKLQISDHVYTLDINNLKKCVTIKNMFDDVDFSDIDFTIPLTFVPNDGDQIPVTKNIFDFIVETFINSSSSTDGSTVNFDELVQSLDNFVQTHGYNSLYTVLIIINYLEMSEYITVICKYIAKCLENKTVEEMRVITGIVNTN